MPDGTIAIDETNADKLLDTEQLTVGANTVHRERVRLAGLLAADLAKIVDSEHLAVTEDAPKIVGRSTPLSVALPAGSSVDLDAAAIPTGVTGKLMGALVSCTVACKWVIKGRDGAAETTFGTLMSSGLAGGRPSETWKAPHRNFAQQAGGTNRHFRATVTNLDGRNAADVYATFYWDEV